MSKSIQNRYLPKLASHLRVLSRIGVLRPKHVVSIGIVNVLVVITEMISLGMVIPILQLVEKKGDFSEVADSSRFGAALFSALESIGLVPSLISLSALAVVLVILRQAVNYVGVRMVSELTFETGRQLAIRVYRAVMSARAEFITKMGSGEFVAMADRQCYTAGALIQNYSNLFRSLLLILLYLGTVTYMQPLISVTAFAMISILALLFRKYVAKGRVLSRKMIDYRNWFADYLVERLRGWRQLKIFDRYTQDMGRTEERSLEFRRINVAMALVSAEVALIFAPAITAIGLLLMNIAVQSPDISAAHITFFIVLLFRLIPTLQGVGNRFQALTVNGESLNAVDRQLSRALAAAEIDTGKAICPPLRDKIEYQNVSYSYPDAEMAAVEDLSISFRAGDITAIVGASGGGKSTMIDMIPRILLPQSGRITFDGTDISEYTLASLRQQISFATQDPFIFRASIRDNIRLSAPTASDEQIEEACKLANADRFIHDLPEGYDTIVGETAVGLSGGQRQRLGLARAFLSDSSVILLDEPTSALDYNAEEVIHGAVQELRRRGKTIILIAHRISTIRFADSVVVLDRGRLTDCGRIEDVVGRGGWLSQMIDYHQKDVGV